MNDRSNRIQVLRGTAIFAVVLIHTCPLGWEEVVYRPFMNFGVALFLFLSGYLTRIDDEKWTDKAKKRIVRVIVPYVIWTVIYTFLFASPHRLLFNMLTTRAAIMLYYIFVYVQFVLLTPLLGVLAKSKYRALGWLVTPVSLIAFKYFWVISGIPIPSCVSLLWKISCFGWFTFYYMGIVIGNGMIKVDYKRGILITLLLLSILLQMGEAYLLQQVGTNNYGTQLKITSILSSVLFLLLAYQYITCGKGYSKALSFLGNYSFGVFFLHMLFVKLLSKVNYFSEIPFVFTAILVASTSLLFCWLGGVILGDKRSRWLGLS